MLAKLTKHEFTSIARVGLPAYITMLVVSVIGRVMTWVSSRQYIIDNVPVSFVKIIKVFSSLISTIYVIAFMSLLILTLFYMIYRFYKNFFTDEGYLMLTLPVRSSSLIFSKLFNTWIWLFFSAVIAILSLYITLGHYDELMDSVNGVFDSLKDVIEREGDYLREELGVPLWVFAIEAVICIFMLANRFILTWYAAVSFGLLLSKKHKALGTIFAYIIVDIASWVLMGLFVAGVTKIMPNFLGDLSTSAGKALQASVAGVSITYFIFSALLFWFTSFIMKHRLNLD